MRARKYRSIATCERPFKAEKTVDAGSCMPRNLMNGHCRNTRNNLCYNSVLGSWTNATYIFICSNKLQGATYICLSRERYFCFINCIMYKYDFYTVSQKKRHPFYFCDNFVRCRPILLIFGRNIPEEICSMTVITYLLKIL